MDSDKTEKNPLRKIMIVFAIIVMFFAVLGVVIYALLNSTVKREAPLLTSSPTPWPRIATKEQVQKDITELNDQLKQATADHAAATVILKDNEKQKKVGN